MLKPLNSLLYKPHSRKMSVQVLKEIFLKSVEAVQPHRMIPNVVQLQDSTHLAVGNRTYSLENSCYIVGFGKALLGMALELEKILGNHLKMGLVTVPDKILKTEQVSSRIKFIEGAANNIPDERALSGASEIKKLVENLKSEKDLVFVLISGGGSALLPLPVPPISLAEKQDLIRALSLKGAEIMELNCVRKRISLLKGGGLAELAYPARVVALILSDIIGDPLDFIASGPTTPNLDRAEAAVDIIKKYECYATLPESIKSVLERPRRPPPEDCSVDNHSKYKHVDNFIIGNNQIAAEAAKQHAVSLGFQSAIISTSVAGNVTQISQIYADLARNIASACNPSSSKQPLHEFLGSNNNKLFEIQTDELLKFDFSRKICLIGAGEPTVVVSGGGKGGRNQQLALDFSLQLNKLGGAAAPVDISLLSAGTDGIDGPTDAAGAIGTSDLVNNCLAENINPDYYLTNNDAYHFYSLHRGGDLLIRTGHTGTNVMDIHLLAFTPKQ